MPPHSIQDAVLWELTAGKQALVLKNEKLVLYSSQPNNVKFKYSFLLKQQTDVSEDSGDEVDEDEIFGFISLLNLTERKVSFTGWHLKS